MVQEYRDNLAPDEHGDTYEIASNLIKVLDRLDFTTPDQIDIDERRCDVWLGEGDYDKFIKQSLERNYNEKIRKHT